MHCSIPCVCCPTCAGMVVIHTHAHEWALILTRNAHGMWVGHVWCLFDVTNLQNFLWEPEQRVCGHVAIVCLESLPTHCLDFPRPRVRAPSFQSTLVSICDLMLDESVSEPFTSGFMSHVQIPGTDIGRHVAFDHSRVVWQMFKHAYICI